MNKRLEELVELYFDRRLDAAGMVELEELLRSDADNRQLFWEHGTLEGVLHLWGEMNTGLASVNSGADRDMAGPLTGRSVLDFGPLPKKAWRMTAVLALAACLALGFFVTLHEGPRTGMQQAVTTEAAVERKAVALLVDEKGAVWRKDESPAVGDLLKQGRLRLEGGEATLLFNSGVAMVVAGPADVDLQSADRVYCHYGRVRIHVPAGAEGFVVDSPNGSTTDLGTELAVDATMKGKTRVDVYQGHAEARLPLSGQDGVRMQPVGPGLRAVQMDATTGQITNLEPASTVSSPSLHLLPLPLAESYPQAVLAAKPSHYWRLDRLEDGRVPNEITKDAPLVPINGTTLTADASGRVSALMVNNRGDRGLDAERPWEMSRSGSAVELWFATDSFERCSLATFADQQGGARHTSILELNMQHHGPRLQLISLRYLMRWPADINGGVNLLTEHNYLPYLWHHVVAQQRERRMELYVDGHCVCSGMADELPASMSNWMTFGYSHVKMHETEVASNRRFVGRMAHIALYDHVLTPEQILQHARLGGKK